MFWDKMQHYTTCSLFLFMFENLLWDACISPISEPYFDPTCLLALSLALSALQEFNRDQARAIACGLAMIRRPQKTPKFLLIHGPPGTGKSKTIGGLLYKLLSSVFVFSLDVSFPLHAVHALKDTVICNFQDAFLFPECFVCGYLVRV